MKSKADHWLEEENLTLIAGWARDGLTDAQIAHNIGIARKTLCEWKKRYSVISDTLKRGKEVVDLEVENALLKRALGYKYEEVTRERVFNPASGESETVETKIVTKEVIPDTTAQIYWLKNRRPDKWRDRNIADASADGQLAALIDGLKEPEKGR